MTKLIFGPFRPSIEHRVSRTDRRSGHIIGIDAGSKTIKVVVFDADGNEVYSDYHRHHTNICETLADAFHDIRWRIGDIDARVAVTGSVGIEVARLLGAPFIQEVAAVTKSVEYAYPDADVIIELGGEDSKIVYLGDDPEQRMNSTCAGGTGGFIDSIAYMLGVRSQDMGSLALGASSIYPIASRCAVFAQTDVRPLLNAGIPKSDIAASVLDAMVRQTLGGLACGRPVQGNVVFLGGPLQFNDGLTFRFIRALGLTHQSAIKPREAHLFTAYGAALAAMEEDCTIKVAEVENRLRGGEFGQSSANDLDRLPALFDDGARLAAFRQRHSGPSFEKADITCAHGPLFLGIDAGSTTSKLALIDEEGRLLFSAYEQSKGNVLETVREMLLEAYAAIPKMAAPGAADAALPHIACSAATGYGEDVLRAAFGIDFGVVETVAHATSALELVKDATFVLDIGGQDMKALWIKDGQVVDAVLNEACSSGCGSFLAGTAHAVGKSEIAFSESALDSRAPVDLGTKCTVFMSSRVKHAQKMGVGVEDIAAGCAYSVVQNVFNKILGSERLANIGDRIVVQGGTFKSDAVLRAFEILSGHEVVRPHQSELMGAIGAALIARQRYEAGQCEGGAGLLKADSLRRLAYDRRSVNCEGCQNSCVLSVLDFGNGRIFVSGNKCERGKTLMTEIEAAGGAKEDNASLGESPMAPPNLIAYERELLAAFGDGGNGPLDDVEACAECADSGGGGVSQAGAVKVGLPMSLTTYESTPFWHTLFSEMGFDVAVPASDCEHSQALDAWQSVPAESVCYPAKLMHLRAFSLKDKGSTHIFLPHFERRWHCKVSCDYADVIEDSIEFLRDESISSIRPVLANHVPERICADEEDRLALYDTFKGLCAQAGFRISNESFSRALDSALMAQRIFEGELAQKTLEALEWLRRTDRRGIVLAGRPYHVDKTLCHGIDEMLQDLGFAVLGQVGLRDQCRDMKGIARPLVHDWRSAKNLARLAQYVSRTDNLDMVCLYSFGCGYDVVSIEEARLILEEAGRPITALKTDEIVDVSHIRIRLRTLSDILLGGAPSSPLTTRPNNEVPVKDFGDNARDRDSQDKNDVTCKKWAFSGIDSTDMANARTSTPSDVCFTARVLAAAAISQLEKNPETAEIHLPRVCIDCLDEAVASMVELATGKTPEFVWNDDLTSFWPSFACMGEMGGSAALHGPRDGDTDTGDRCRIAILGNALHCFEPMLNDDLPSLLEELDCEAVYPDPANLGCDDVSYADQLEAFREQGVHDVIYVQSFGCIKANVDVRGQMHRLKGRFPDMRITVIDFDPDSSELNRENRIRLAIETAKRMRPR